MKIKHFEKTVGCRISEETKLEAERILLENNKSLSDYIREKIFELVKENENE